MSANILLSVAFGGALGAVGRYVLMSQVGSFHSGAFPLATLIVNVAGSFLLGVLVEVMALSWSPTPEVRAMLVVGVLGGFTTFSTFSLDIAYMIERNTYLLAGGYIAMSVILSVAGFFSALFVTRLVMT